MGEVTWDDTSPTCEGIGRQALPCTSIPGPLSYSHLTVDGIDLRWNMYPCTGLGIAVMCVCLCPEVEFFRVLRTFTAAWRGSHCLVLSLVCKGLQKLLHMGLFTSLLSVGAPPRTWPLRGAKLGVPLVFAPLPSLSHTPVLSACCGLWMGGGGGGAYLEGKGKNRDGCRGWFWGIRPPS